MGPMLWSWEVGTPRHGTLCLGALVASLLDHQSEATPGHLKAASHHRIDGMHSMKPDFSFRTWHFTHHKVIHRRLLKLHGNLCIIMLKCGVLISSCMYWWQQFWQPGLQGMVMTLLLHPSLILTPLLCFSQLSHYYLRCLCVCSVKSHPVWKHFDKILIPFF